jgi:hypothetical protein
MRLHQANQRPDAFDYLFVEVNNRHRVAFDVECVFMKRNDPAGPYCLRRAAHQGHGIGLVAQYVSTDCSIERWVLRECIIRSDHEINLSISR